MHRIVELLAVAVVGALLALLGAASFGKLGSHTTIQQVTPLGGGGVGNATLQTPARGLSGEQIYDHDAPGVVQITATSVTRTQADPFNIFPATPQTSESLGSGFVIDKAGHIVTNEHVIAGAQRIQVSFSGQDQIPATVVGKDPSTDLAVLKIDAHARALRPLELGNSDGVRVGDGVYAIGNPFGFTRTLTSGIVSAIGRQISAPNSLPIDNAIQTDAAINHGNSGGPLIDTSGRVIGVTSQISTGTTGQQGNVGIGFAIPVNLVRNVAAQIIKNGKVEHPFLGIGVAELTKQVSGLFNLPAHGLLVQKVDPGSAAAKAGIKAGGTSVVVEGQSWRIGGDVITAVDGHTVSTYSELRDAINRKKPGDTVKLDVVRHGQKSSVSVKLGQAPQTSG
jgi:S1-C subfamily serine protease